MNHHQQQPPTREQLLQQIMFLQQIIVELGGTQYASRVYNPAFQSARQMRMTSRQQVLCRENRNGNSAYGKCCSVIPSLNPLDSCPSHKREKKTKPIQAHNAPPGTLNCGCTPEDALFEESLERNGVTRVDIAARRHLLELLKGRYAYRDGDFEIDPRTGNWVPGQDPTTWQHKAQQPQSQQPQQH